MAKRKIHDNKCLLLFCLSVTVWLRYGAHASAEWNTLNACRRAFSISYRYAYTGTLFRAGNFDFNANKIETLTFYISSAAAKVENIINSQRFCCATYP